MKGQISYRTQTSSVKVSLTTMGLEHIRKPGLGDPRLAELYVGPTTCLHWEIFKGDNKKEAIDTDRKGLLQILTKQILNPENSGKQLKNGAED